MVTNELYAAVRSESNLFAAWRHVRRSAQNSKNSEIRGRAAEFEHQHQRHLKRIAQQLREGRFQFDDVDGVLKDKKARERDGKDPRPIAVGTIKNRVVQRSILQVLQPRSLENASDPRARYLPTHDARLGRLNDVNTSRFGVGGLMKPYGGVQPAIALVMEAMRRGAKYFYQSDIKAFFTAIPTENVVGTVRAETKDDLLSDLFASALEVNLANKEDLLTYERLFPRNGIGVAQGSSLSALAGNILLYDLDHELNAGGVTAVRYIDDIFILADSEKAVENAVAVAKSKLSSFKFALYPAVPGSTKANKGLCKDSFTFLGCTIQPNRCVPSAGSVEKICSEVHSSLSQSKRSIKRLVQGSADFDPEHARSAVLSRIGRKVYGWEKSFAFCTDAQAFKQLDDRIASYVDSYEQIVGRLLAKAPTSVRTRAIGIPCTQQLYESDQARLSGKA